MVERPRCIHQAQGLGVFVRLDERLDFFGYDDRYLWVLVGLAECS